MSIISLRLPDHIDSSLNHEAELTHRPKSELAREAITEYLDRKEQKRFLAEIARAARARDPKEALAMAEEALSFDNESLELAEGRRVHEPRAKYSVRRKRN